MTGAMTAFVIVGGAVAAICYLQMGRVQRRAERRASGDTSGSDGRNYAGGGGSNSSGWSGGHSSGFHDSGGSSDSGGGGGDSGGSGGGDYSGESNGTAAAF